MVALCSVVALLKPLLSTLNDSSTSLLIEIYSRHSELRGEVGEVICAESMATTHARSASWALVALGTLKLGFPSRATYLSLEFFQNIACSEYGIFTFIFPIGFPRGLEKFPKKTHVTYSILTSDLKQNVSFKIQIVHGHES